MVAVDEQHAEQVALLKRKITHQEAATIKSIRVCSSERWCTSHRQEARTRLQKRRGKSDISIDTQHNIGYFTSKPLAADHCGWRSERHVGLRQVISPNV